MSVKSEQVEIGRASDRILKVARTLADLAGDEQLQTHHVAEAVQYRTINQMQ